ncbi:unnamed protein product [Closterium sp. NIES-65]|nr:unnamed protein product [Closterium sp. NIES-65]
MEPWGNILMGDPEKPCIWKGTLIWPQVASSSPQTLLALSCRTPAADAFLSDCQGAWGANLPEGWTAGGNCQDASYLTCDAAGMIIDITMENVTLGGPLPDSIGDLAQLTHLQLKYNELTSTIPDSISLLTNLVYLLLGDNGLTGSIPDSITLLTNLVYLSSPQLCTSHHASHRPSVSPIRAINGNNITGIIPPSIGNLAALSHL